MFLMLPNLKIGLKTTCKWWKIQEVAFRTNIREKWNPENGDDCWLLSLEYYFEFIQTLELEKCIENMLITFSLLIQQIIVMSLVKIIVILSIIFKLIVDNVKIEISLRYFRNGLL